MLPVHGVAWKYHVSGCVHLGSLLMEVVDVLAAGEGDEHACSARCLDFERGAAMRASDGVDVRTANYHL